MNVHPITRNSGKAPVVALHSSASTGAQWKKLLEDMEGRYDVIAPDLPGYGNGHLTADDEQDGVAAAAAPIIRRIEAFGTQVHLVGHSFGANIALKIAMMRPDLIKSLCLYEPACFHFLRHGDQTDRDLFSGIVDISETLSANAQAGDPEKGMRRFIDFWNGADAWQRMPDYAQRHLSTQANSVMDDFRRGFAENWMPDELARLEMPTLVMMGMESPALAQCVAMRITDAIPGARLAMLPGLGHMAPLSAPKWVNPRIIGHIATVERQANPVHWPVLSAA